MTTEYWRNEANKNAMSGSELMMTELEKNLDKDLLDNFQIVLSRPELHELDENKVRILWCHDLAEDGQVASFLSNEGWRRFHRFVFVSNWQCQRYIERYNIPWERTIVMRNAINPIDVDIEKKWTFPEEDAQINFVYHTTPHRGLHILAPVFAHLCEEFSNIHLDVFSSFKIYGWEQEDQRPEFQQVFDMIKEHDHMTLHETLPNADMQRHLAEKAHVFSYPSTHTETSCRALIEAMSAGCMCIHPNNGALFETAAQFTFMYHYDTNPQRHAGMHFATLTNAIELIRSNDPALKMKLSGQKSYADVNYSWDVRKREWEAFLGSIKDLPREIEEANAGTTFSYEVNY